MVMFKYAGTGVLKCAQSSPAAKLALCAHCTQGAPCWFQHVSSRIWLWDRSIPLHLLTALSAGPVRCRARGFGRGVEVKMTGKLVGRRRLDALQRALQRGPVPEAHHDWG